MSNPELPPAGAPPEEEDSGSESSEEASSSEDESSGYSESSEGVEATYKPLLMWSWGARRPVCSFCLALLAWMAVFAAFITLALEDASFWFFDPDQQLVFARGDVYSDRADAVTAGMQEANGPLGIPQDQLRQSVPLEGEAEEGDLSLELIYVPRTGNVFETRHLRKIMEIEDYIMGHAGYSSHCLLAWNATELAGERTKIAASQGRNWTLAAAPPSPPPPAGASAVVSFLPRCAPPLSAAWACNPAAGSCEAQAGRLALDPPGVLHCNASSPGFDPRYGCLRSQMILGTQVPVGGGVARPFHEYAAEAMAAGASAANRTRSVERFLTYTDVHFGAPGGGGVSRALRSTFTMALPLAGYANAADRTDEQRAKVRDFLRASYGAYLSGGPGGEDLEVRWRGYGQEREEWLHQLGRSGWLAAGALGTTWLLMQLCWRSLFLAGVGCAHLALSFSGALLVYRGGLFGEEGMGLQLAVVATAASLIPSAGALFAMTDAWLQSGAHQGPVSADALSRISYAWGRGARAGLVSGAAASACFLCLKLSSFPGLASLGLLAALVTVCSVCSAALFWPCALLAHHALLNESPFWLTAITRGFSRCRGRRRRGGQVNPASPKTAGAFAVGDDDDDDEGDGGWAEDGELRWAEEFFSQSYAPLLVEARWFVVLLGCAAAALLALRGARVDVAPEPAPLLASGNFRDYPEADRAHFSGALSVDAVDVRLVLGLRRDRPGPVADARSGDYAATGVPVWAPSQLLTVNVNLALNAYWFHAVNASANASSLGCLEQICDAAEAQSAGRVTAGAAVESARCWVREFHAWTDATRGSLGPAGRSGELGAAFGIDVRTYSALAWRDVRRDPTVFYPLLYDWLHSPDPLLPHRSAYARWKPYLWAELPTATGASSNSSSPGLLSTSPLDPMLRMAFASLRVLAEQRSVSPATGLAVAGAWDTWLAEELGRGECAASPAVLQPAVGGALVSAAPGGGWARLELRAEIKDELVLAGWVGLAAAAAALALALFNWYLALLGALAVALVQCAVLGAAAVLGWGVGEVEILLWAVLPGLAVAPVAQVLAAYQGAADLGARAPRVALALTYCGVTIASTALVAAAAGGLALLSGAHMVARLGALVLVADAASALASLVFLPGLLCTFLGPYGSFGTFNVLARRRTPASRAARGDAAGGAPAADGGKGDGPTAGPGLTVGEDGEVYSQYRVAVVTTDRKFAGTDAGVSCVLFGERGDSGWQSLENSAQNFDRGRVDVFVVSSRHLGRVTRVLIGHDNGVEGAAWHMDRVEVLCGHTGASYVFPCGRWLSADDPPYECFQELEPAPEGAMGAPCDYRIRVQTSDLKGAGTDATVSIKLVGAAGATEFVKLDNEPVNFDRARRDEFVLPMRDVGPLHHITIGHDGRGGAGASRWHLDTVEVMNMSTGDGAGFECGDWLEGKTAVRTLMPAGMAVGGRMAAAGPNTRWEVTCHTSDVRNAGTRAPVLVSLHGDGVTAGPAAVSGGGDFSRGAHAVAVVDLPDVGEVESVTVRLDGSGGGPDGGAWAGARAMWHCQMVEVKHVGSGRQWYFPCGEWLDEASGLERELFPAGSDLAGQGGVGARNTYKVLVVTAGGMLSGTTARVGLELFGPTSDGESLAMPLEGPGNTDQPFAAGRESSYILEGRGLGPLSRVVVKLESPGVLDWWKLERLEVVDCGERRRYAFTCGQWLSRMKGADREWVRGEDPGPRGLLLDAEGPDAAQPKAAGAGGGVQGVLDGTAASALAAGSASAAAPERVEGGAAGGADARYSVVFHTGDHMGRGATHSVGFELRSATAKWGPDMRVLRKAVPPPGDKDKLLPGSTFGPPAVEKLHPLAEEVVVGGGGGGDDSKGDEGGPGGSDPPAAPEAPKSRDLFGHLRRYMRDHGEEVAGLFQGFDTDGDGRLATDEVGALVRAVVADVTEREMRHFLVMVDADGNGSLSMGELKTALRGSRDVYRAVRAGAGAADVVGMDDVLWRMDDRIRARGTTATALFREHDGDGSGFLEPAELRALFKSLLPAMRADELRYLLAHVEALDANGDGRVSLAELRKALRAKARTAGAPVGEPPPPPPPAPAAGDGDAAAAGNPPPPQPPLASRDNVDGEVFNVLRAYLKGNRNKVSRMYAKIDRNRDGIFQADEVRTFVKELVPAITARRLHHLMVMIDTEGEGEGKISQRHFEGSLKVCRDLREALQSQQRLGATSHAAAQQAGAPALRKEVAETVAAAEAVLEQLVQYFAAKPAEVAAAWREADPGGEGLTDGELRAMFERMYPGMRTNDWRYLLTLVDVFGTGAAHLHGRTTLAELFRIVTHGRVDAPAALLAAGGGGGGGKEGGEEGKEEEPPEVVYPFGDKYTPGAGAPMPAQWYAARPWTGREQAEAEARAGQLPEQPRQPLPLPVIPTQARSKAKLPASLGTGRHPPWLPTPVQWQRWHRRDVQVTDELSSSLPMSIGWWQHQWDGLWSWWRASATSGVSRNASAQREAQAAHPGDPIQVRSGLVVPSSQLEVRGAEPMTAALVPHVASLAGHLAPAFGVEPPAVEVSPLVVGAKQLEFRGTRESGALGEVTSIRVWNTASEPAWFLEKVEVRSLATGRQWTFHHREWVVPPEEGDDPDLILRADPHAWERWDMGRNSRGGDVSCWYNLNTKEFAWEEPPAPPLGDMPGAVPSEEVLWQAPGRPPVATPWWRAPAAPPGGLGRILYLDELGEDPATGKPEYEFATRVRERYPLGRGGRMGPAFGDRPLEVRGCQLPHAYCVQAKGGVLRTAPFSSEDAGDGNDAEDEYLTEAVVVSFDLARAARARGEEYLQFVSSFALEDHMPRDARDEVEAESQVVFTVVGDGRILWQSQPVQDAGEVRTCAVALEGVGELRIVVECEKGGSAHAVLCDPHLVVGGAGAVLVEPDEEDGVPQPVGNPVRFAWGAGAQGGVFFMHEAEDTPRLDRYRVSVYTSDLRHAGTTARTSIKLLGERDLAPGKEMKATGWLPLETAARMGSRQFGRGSRHDFFLDVPDLGRVTKVYVKHDGSGMFPAWHLQHVEVQNEVTSDASCFFCGEWLGGGKPLVRTLAREGLGGGMTKYKVTVYTGDVVGAGTDADVTLFFYGEGADGVERSAPADLRSSANNFERAAASTFLVEVPDVGQLKRVTLLHSSSWPFAAWYVEQVEVMCLATGETLSFPVHGWLDKGKGQRVRLMPQKKRTYKVKVTTSDRKGAGTDANVKAVLYGDRGDSGEQALAARGRDNFERGCENAFFLRCGDLGRVREIKIWHDGFGLGAGWHLAQVEVTDGEGRATTFPCGEWLDSNEGDGKTERTLLPAGVDARGTRYLVMLWLQDIYGSGRDAAESIDLWGVKDGATASTGPRSCETSETFAYDRGLDLKWLESARQLALALPEANPTHTYRIAVYTDDANGPAAPDAGVSLVVMGDRGDSGDVPLVSDVDGRTGPELFGESKVSYFSVQRANLGRLMRVKVQHESHGWEWNLSKVQVVDETSGESVMFPCGAPVGGRAPESRVLFPAGCDVFRVEAADVGKVRQVLLRHDNPGLGAGWALEKVEVFSEATGETYLFPAEHLEEHEPDEEGGEPRWVRQLLTADQVIGTEAFDDRGGGEETHGFVPPPKPRRVPKGSRPPPASRAPPPKAPPPPLPAPEAGGGGGGARAPAALPTDGDVPEWEEDEEDEEQVDEGGVDIPVPPANDHGGEDDDVPEWEEEEEE